jgi:hypothetical protein
MRRWFLGRVRVTYKQRNQIKFMGGEYDLEPTDQPPHTLDSKGEMKPSERNSPSKISPKERRKLVAIGIKAGKSRRLIAHELNVTETTIRRDMKVQGIPANKKPTTTRRKPAVVFKASSPATSDRKVVSHGPTKFFKPAPPLVVPPKPRPPKLHILEVPLSPEQLRRQHLEEMLQLVQAWLVERDPDYQRAENVLDKARIRLATRRDSSARGLSESPMSAAQLWDYTRPQEMDAASSQNLSRREEVCAIWLARWLAAWEPKDEKLRNHVLNQVRALVTA